MQEATPDCTFSYWHVLTVLLTYSSKLYSQDWMGIHARQLSIMSFCAPGLSPQFAYYNSAKMPNLTQQNAPTHFSTLTSFYDLLKTRTRRTVPYVIVMSQRRRCQFNGHWSQLTRVRLRAQKLINSIASDQLLLSKLTTAVLSQGEPGIEFYNGIARFLCHVHGFLLQVYNRSTSATVQMLKLHTVRWFSRPWRKITAIAENHDARPIKITAKAMVIILHYIATAYTSTNFGSELPDRYLVSDANRNTGTTGVLWALLVYMQNCQPTLLVFNRS